MNESFYATLYATLGIWITIIGAMLGLIGICVKFLFEKTIILGDIIIEFGLKIDSEG